MPSTTKTILGHRVTHKPGRGYTVHPYGRTFTTKSEARAWLKGHVAREARRNPVTEVSVTHAPTVYLRNPKGKRKYGVAMTGSALVAAGEASMRGGRHARLADDYLYETGLAPVQLAKVRGLVKSKRRRNPEPRDRRWAAVEGTLDAAAVGGHAMREANGRAVDVLGQHGPSWHVTFGYAHGNGAFQPAYGMPAKTYKSRATAEKAIARYLYGSDVPARPRR